MNGVEGEIMDNNLKRELKKHCEREFIEPNNEDHSQCSNTECDFNILNNYDGAFNCIFCYPALPKDWKIKEELEFRDCGNAGDNNPVILENKDGSPVVIDKKAVDLAGEDFLHKLNASNHDCSKCKKPVVLCNCLKDILLKKDGFDYTKVSTRCNNDVCRYFQRKTGWDYECVLGHDIYNDNNCKYYT